MDMNATMEDREIAAEPEWLDDPDEQADPPIGSVRNGPFHRMAADMSVPVYLDFEARLAEVGLAVGSDLAESRSTSAFSMPELRLPALSLGELRLPELRIAEHAASLRDLARRSLSATSLSPRTGALIAAVALVLWMTAGLVATAAVAAVALAAQAVRIAAETRAEMLKGVHRIADGLDGIERALRGPSLRR